MNVDWEAILPIQGEIIVVEDDPLLRSLLVDFIEDMGAKASAFDSADKALTYLLHAHEQCCLVVADYGVPGQVQGIEFIEMVRGQWPTISAILTSGFLLDPAIVPPSTIYLQKPWSLNDMAIAVTSLLQPGKSIRKN